MSANQRLIIKSRHELREAKILNRSLTLPSHIQLLPELAEVHHYIRRKPRVVSGLSQN